MRIAELSTRESAPDIEVAPNGFYIPKLQDESHQSPLRLDNRSTSFCAIANVAASPVSPTKTSQSRQRQLISGRDFNDILEACRPDTTKHILPSALVSLLALRDVTKRKETGKIDTKEAVALEERSEHHHKEEKHRDGKPLHVPASSQLKEWGAVDFDSVASLMSTSPSSFGRKWSHDFGASSHLDTLSDRSSPTSSLSSHLSNLRSRSLERPTSFYSYGGGFRLRSGSWVDGIKMQRSPSMDSLELGGKEMVSGASDDNISDSAIPEEAEDTAKEAEKRGNDETKETDSSLNEADCLRQLMKQHDANFFKRDRTTVGQKAPQMSSMHASDESLESAGTMPVSK